MKSKDSLRLYRFYNERLEHLGISDWVENVTQLSQMDKLSAASAGVGLAVLDFWIVGRSRMKALNRVKGVHTDRHG